MLFDDRPYQRDAAVFILEVALEGLVYEGLPRPDAVVGDLDQEDFPFVSIREAGAKTDLPTPIRERTEGVAYEFGESSTSVS